MVSLSIKQGVCAQTPVTQHMKKFLVKNIDIKISMPKE